MTKLNGSETSYMSKMSIGSSLPKSHKLGKIKTGSRPDIGQFITKEQGTVAFCKTDETRFRWAQFLKKSDKIFLLKKKNSQRKITCHRAQTWKKRIKEDNTGVWENISILLFSWMVISFFLPQMPGFVFAYDWLLVVARHVVPFDSCAPSIHIWILM